jgi:hypothetical protein
MHTIGDLRRDMNRIKSSRTYRLKQDVENARENGVDLLANLARELQCKINASKRGLTSLIDRFHRFSKNPIKRGVNSPTTILSRSRQI